MGSRLGGFDVQRISAAVQRPGIDPRVWSSDAVVLDYRVDPEVGPLADVLLIPDETEHTAQLGTVYAGNGWGVYAPVAVDDVVTVVAPSGHPDNGLVIVARKHSGSDPPPDAAVATPDDLILHVSPANNLKLIVSGTGTVRIGSADAGEPLVLGSQLTAMLSTILDALGSHTHTVTAVATPGNPPALIPSTSPNAPEAATFAAQKVKVDNKDLESATAYTKK